MSFMFQKELADRGIHLNSSQVEQHFTDEAPLGYWINLEFTVLCRTVNVQAPAPLNPLARDIVQFVTMGGGLHTKLCSHDTLPKVYQDVISDPGFPFKTWVIENITYTAKRSDPDARSLKIVLTHVRMGDPVEEEEIKPPTPTILGHQERRKKTAPWRS